MTFRLPSLATAMLAAVSSPVVWAQQVPASSPSTSAARPQAEPPSGSGELPEVRVDGARDRDSFNASTSSTPKVGELRDTPQSITVLNKALLQTQGATSLADALRNVPGITLGGAEGGQIGNNINLNGFSARTDIYLDGFRDRGQYFRDTFALDSVEVLQGPSSMLFGRGSTGGVINQVSKRPSLVPYTEASASVTTNGLVRTSVDRNQPLDETTAFRIAAMAQDGKPTTRDVMKNRDFGLAPSLSLGLGTPTVITFAALLQHNHDQPDYGVSPLNGHPVKVDRDAFYGYTSDRTVQDVVALSASIDHTFSAAMKLRNQTQYNDVRLNAIETSSQSLGTISTTAGFIPLANAAGILPLSSLYVRMQSHDRVIHDKSIFNQTDFSARIDGGGFVKHNLILGAEVGHDSYTNDQYYRNGSCDGVASTGTSGYVSCVPLIDSPHVDAPVVARSNGNVAGSTATTAAAYVGDTVELGPRFKLVGGVREDYYKASISNSLTLPLRVEQSVNFTGVRAGGIWQPSATQSYYLSYSTSFNPSLEQLTNTTSTTAPLPPEKNRAYELGAKWDPVGNLFSTNAAIFQITKTNARSQGSDGTYIADGTVRVQGGRLGASGELMKGLKLFAGYAFLDAKIIDAIAVGTQNKVPTNTPRHTATLWSTCEVAPHWEVGGGATYLSKRYLNNTNLVEVGGYARLDGTLAYRQRTYDIRLNFFNLANRNFYDALIQSDSGRAVPGTGRSAMLSVTYHL